MTDDPALLFVYGTLRRGSILPMARLLDQQARWIGLGHVRGTLHRLDGYPGFVPEAQGEGGRVVGDLFAMADPATLLPLIDAYEECSADFPEPREYRRARIMVEAADGAMRAAWTYIYAWPVAGLPLIESGEFRV